MSEFWADYRGLFDAALYHTDGDTYAAVLAPWAAANPGARDWLRDFAARPGDPVPPASPEDLWQLYALGRALDIITPDPQGLSAAEFVAFAESPGLTTTPARPFSPFYHEIVTVEQDPDPATPPAVTGAVWPGVSLGDMTILRAGVRIAAGADHVVKDVAESSTMYWAWVRGTRPARDLSHGWGSNSQWRTDFRRDYRFGDALHYNVDGKFDLLAADLPADESHGLTRAERVELLTHRCFVTTRRPADEELWPYDDRFRDG